MSDLPIPKSITIHQVAGLEPGPKLAIFGAVHGNETCGTVAIRRILQEIDQGELTIERGTLTLVPVVNPLAYQLKRRHGDRNLNRNMRVTADPQDFEDRLSNVICTLLEAHDVLLDLHSFHTPGIPFALFGPKNNSGSLEPFAKAEEEEALALQLGVDRFVEGWLETYAQGVRDRQARGAEAHVDYGVGTTETIRRYGGMGVTLECGQHDDEQAPQVAYRAIRSTLAHLGMAVPEPDPVPPSRPEVIRLYKVWDRLHPDDRFSRDWRSFEQIRQGDVLAIRHDGAEVAADQDGWIVFPNPGAQVDQEWFYLAKKSDRLSLS
jgi:predicted deacylase